jgi:hypothetical protein
MLRRNSRHCLGIYAPRGNKSAAFPYGTAADLVPEWPRARRVRGLYSASTTGNTKGGLGTAAAGLCGSAGALLTQPLLSERRQVAGRERESLTAYCRKKTVRCGHHLLGEMARCYPWASSVS